MINRFLKNIDWWITIPIGFITLLSNILLPYDESTRCMVLCNILCVISGSLGVLYLFYAIILWGQGPKFDWHLIHGHFLRKVCCLVLLMPSTLSCIGMLVLDSPKELVFDPILYSYGNDDLPLEIKIKQKSPNIYWSTYYHFIDPGNQSMTTTKGARAWVSIISMCGMLLLNGLLVSSIIGWIDRRKEMWLKGEIKYPIFFRRNSHYIIIGGNDMVEGIVKQLLPSMKPILIQTSTEIEKFRKELFSSLNEKEQKRIIIYYGSRTSKEDVKCLCYDRAEEIYIIGEDTRTDDMESFHDTMNMECLRLINEEIRTFHSIEKKERIVCRVMFEYQTTFSVFQFYDIDKTVEKVIDFRPFNFYELWAQKVLVNKEISTKGLKEIATKGGFLPLEGVEGIKKEDESYVHLFIVGMSRMGVAMGIEAAHLSHYPNYEKKKIRTKITFIDKNAAEEKDFFTGRFKELFALSHWRYANIDKANELDWQKIHAPLGFDYLGGDFLDVEWEFINGGIEQTVIQNYILSSANPNAKVSIAICLPESNRAHAAALYIDKKIYALDNVLQVLVYNCYGDSIIQSLSSKSVNFPYLNKLKAFGATKECIETNLIMQSELVGMAIGDRYQEINELFVKPAKEKTNQRCDKGGYKGKSTTAKKWSSIYNGNSMWTKLRSIGYTNGALSSEQIKDLSDVEHNRWNIEQLLMHFRPLTQKEQEDVIKGKKDKEDLKMEMAHLNICSNKRLKELSSIDVVARAYDEGLTYFLPEIYYNLQKTNSNF